MLVYQPARSLRGGCFLRLRGRSDLRHGRSFFSTNATGKGGERVEEDSPRRVVIFGGNGFVGRNVCEAALSLGREVVSVSRSGRPQRASAAWADKVQWVKGDIFETESYAHILQGAEGAVSCVGAFGTDEFMRRICGEATVTAAEAAATARVRNFCFISAAGTGESPHLVLRGYFEGKRLAEDAILKDFFPETGVVLRPAGIYGNRDVGGITIPLGLVMRPAEAILSKVVPDALLQRAGPLKAALTPPVAVENVGMAAARAACSLIKPGILTVLDINEYGRR